MICKPGFKNIILYMQITFDCTDLKNMSILSQKIKRGLHLKL